MALTGDQLELLADLAVEYQNQGVAERYAADAKADARERIIAVLKNAGVRDVEVAGLRVTLDARDHQSIPLELARKMLTGEQLAVLVQTSTSVVLTVKRVGV